VADSGIWKNWPNYLIFLGVKSGVVLSSQYIVNLWCRGGASKSATESYNKVTMRTVSFKWLCMHQQKHMYNT
jgi:hypothetical protein